MMFYTGEDLSQAHGPLPTSNGTLAMLNQKKFQRRQSEKEMALFSEDGKYFADSQIFYREKKDHLLHTDEKELDNDAQKQNMDFRSTDNLPDLVTESEIRSQSVTQVESFNNDLFDFGQLDPIETDSGKSEYKLDFGKQESGNEDEENKRGKLVRGLKSVDNPDVITFREQSEWLDKLVTEELKSQKIKKEKESIEPTPANIPTPVNAAQNPPTDLKSPGVEESPIVLQNRKEWLETLAQQGYSPRSNDSNNGDHKTTNRLSKMEPIQVEIPSQQLSPRESKIAQNQFSMDFTNQDHIDRESLTDQNKIPGESSDQEVRGDAFMMPSKIKELQSAATTPREPYSSHLRGHTSGPKFNGYTHTKIYETPNEERPQNHGLDDNKTALNQRFDNLNIQDQRTNYGPDVKSSADILPPQSNPKDEVDYKPAGVKDRLKAFQSPRDTTETPSGDISQTPRGNAYSHRETVDDFIVQVEKSPITTTNSYSQGPKSYHAGTAGSGDYRYYGNDYDSTKFHPVAQQKKPEIRSNMKIELVQNQDNSNIGKSGLASNPKATNSDSNNNSNNIDLGFEYKHCVKDSRILMEIAEQENRENEIRKQRNPGDSPAFRRHYGPDVGGGLEQFLQENEQR